MPLLEAVAVCCQTVLCPKEVVKWLIFVLFGIVL